MEIHNITHRTELSLTTKLFHTAHPDQGIIIDKYVREFCGRENDTLDIQLYENIKKDFETDYIQDLAKRFDELFPNVTDIKPFKKIDFMIWGWGKWRKWTES